MGWRELELSPPLLRSEFTLHAQRSTHYPTKKVPPGYAGGRVPPRRSRGGDGRRRVHRTTGNIESVHEPRQGQDDSTTVRPTDAPLYSHAEARAARDLRESVP